MRSLKHVSDYLLCTILWCVCLFAGCKRHIPELPTNELRNVTFKLAGFEAEVTPLDGMKSAALQAFDGLGGMQALKNIEPGLEPQYLYFWSFNAEDLEPDIAVDEEGAEITFEAVAASPTYPNSTFAVEPYPGGKAFSLRGGRNVTLKLPLQGVESLSEFAFDISSSDTGPKAFSLSYSFDGGETYVPFVENRQFANMEEQKRNPYQFDFSSIWDGLTTVLNLKFDFLAGDRDTISDYNETQGTVRLDNIRLSGVYNAEVETGDPTVPTTLHYYVFSAGDGAVVQQQQLSMTALGEGGALDIKLADGSYDVLFVAYRSDKGMLLPDNVTNANEFYFGQHFNDYRAVTYAVLLDNLVVDGRDAEMEAVLRRCYSLVEFDFTDLAADLLRVKKIEVTKQHGNFLYTPFGEPAEEHMSDIHTIEFSGFDGADDYRIALHQFFGLLVEDEAITYELTAYGEGGVALNTVTISQSIRNNVRLRLRGRLLGDTGAINGFSIALDPEWGELLDREF